MRRSFFMRFNPSKRHRQNHRLKTLDEGILPAQTATSQRKKHYLLFILKLSIVITRFWSPRKNKWHNQHHKTSQSKRFIAISLPCVRGDKCLTGDHRSNKTTLTTRLSIDKPDKTHSVLKLLRLPVFNIVKLNLRQIIERISATKSYPFDGRAWQQRGLPQYRSIQTYHYRVDSGSI